VVFRHAYKLGFDDSSKRIAIEPVVKETYVPALDPPRRGFFGDARQQIRTAIQLTTPPTVAASSLFSC